LASTDAGKAGAHCIGLAPGISGGPIAVRTKTVTVHIAAGMAAITATRMVIRPSIGMKLAPRRA
jgi:hypothetical protein